MRGSTTVDLEIHRMQHEIASLRSDLATLRMRMMVNALTIDFGCILAAACVVLFVALKFT